MKSIKLKLVVIYLILVFIVLIVSGTFMITTIRYREIEKANYTLKTYASLIQAQIINEYEDAADFQKGFEENIFMSTSSFGKLNGNILNSKGITIASTDGVGQRFNRSVISIALSGSEATSSGKKDTDINDQRKTWEEYALPVKNQQGEIEYVIYVRMNSEPIMQNLLSITITIILTLVLALALTGILGFLFANTLTEPIILLTKKANEMAHGNLNQEIAVNSKDEVGQLTESFNFMARELNANILAIASSRNKLEIIMHNMTDGVLAYDSKGLLIHANPSAIDLLGLSEMELLSFSDMMKRFGIPAENLQEINTESLNNLSMNGKFLNVSLSTYYNKNQVIDGVVIVLQDITKHKKLDDMRKQFVANVSHEIRTPLTTIKTYAESILDWALQEPDMAVEFLKIIDSETDRMTLLVKDLLDLSRFDNNQVQLEFSLCDLNDVCSLSIKHNKILLDKKNQSLEFIPLCEPAIINADFSRLNQVFSNVISNAIKYTPDGGRIEVLVEQTDKYYRVYIQDNGIGIPKEDLKNIFERFYRVDKARSREMGGTGLGLSIAKEFVELHGGKILALSEPGRGTTMIIRLNKPSRSKKN